MASTTVEDYIKQLYLIEQAGEQSAQSLIGMGDISAAMDVQAGTVTSMMKTLAEAGLVEYEPRQGVRLTTGGRTLALHVLRSHRLIELFLVEVLGFDWSEVHDEAERLEHVVSERFLESIDNLMGNPQRDPHGDPIPSKLGIIKTPDAIPASKAKNNTAYRLSRVSRQEEGFLRTLSTEGFTPGVKIEKLISDPVRGTIAMHGVGGSVLILSSQMAESIFLEEV